MYLLRGRLHKTASTFVGRVKTFGESSAKRADSQNARRATRHGSAARSAEVAFSSLFCH